MNKNESDCAVLKLAAVKHWLKAFDLAKHTDVKIYTGIGFIDTVTEVMKNNFDLVVKCAEDVDWLDRLFASDDMHLLRKCPCPVLMLKPTQKNIFRNVMATVDVNNEHPDPKVNRVQNELNISVLDYSTTFSLSELTALHVCSVWDAFGESHLRYSAFSTSSEDTVDRYVEEIRHEYSDKLRRLISNSNASINKDAAEYLKPKIHLVKGDPSQQIPLMANTYNIDLIVMGTVARTGIPGFIIGNTAESILEQVKCSVLAIKPDGFVSPVTA